MLTFSSVPRGAFLLGVTLISAVPVMAPACMGVGERGRFVAFGDQTNIVVWNPDTQTEHFVRNAIFRSDARDFGFIAPTPTRPELSEVSSEAFVTLGKLAPRDLRPRAMAMGGSAGMEDASAKASVVVVQEADVAGYHATTLLADDAGALAAWMQANGYTTTPAVEAWTQTYISKGWYLTAFKVSNKRGVASTGTVRMSFQTSQPFNPFYVPQDNIRPGQTGTLKVYFVSNDSYSASIGSGEPWNNCQWAASVPRESVGNLARQLKLPTSAFPDNMRVEEFEDSDFPRLANDDIFFKQGPVPVSLISDDLPSSGGITVPISAVEPGDPNHHAAGIGILVIVSCSVAFLLGLLLRRPANPR